MIILIIAGIAIFDSDMSVLEKIRSRIKQYRFRISEIPADYQDISLFFFLRVIIMVMMKPEFARRLDELKLPLLKEIGLVMFLAFASFRLPVLPDRLTRQCIPDWLSVWKVDGGKRRLWNSIINQALFAPSFAMMILNLFIIAILPAVGEEFFFRGVLQKILINFFKSGHRCQYGSQLLFSVPYIFSFLDLFQIYSRIDFWLPVFLVRHTMDAGNFTFY